MSRRVFRSLFLMLAAFIALAPGVRAQEEPGNVVVGDEAAIRQRYAAFDKLLLDRDLDGVVALMTRDATFESNNGKRRNVTQWRQAFDPQMKSLVVTKTRVESVTLKGNSAEVKTWNEQRYENLHVKGVDQTKFIIRSAAMDKWVKTDGGWKLKSSKQQQVDVQPLD